MSDPKNQAEQDVRILAFLEGRMEPQERAAFELRLGREPELARAFGEIADTVHDVRLALSANTQIVPRRGSRYAWVAAAAVILSLGALWFSKSRSLPYSTAIVASAPSDEGFNEVLGLEASWLPAGMSYRGSGDTSGASSPPSAAEYAKAANAALQEHVERSFAEPPHDPRAFLMAVRPANDCYAMLYIARLGGQVERLFPLDVASPSMLRRDETHLLPAPPVALPPNWRELQRVDYRPGVLTRGGVSVLLALRRTQPSAREFRSLDAFASSATLESVEALLARSGWTCQVQHVGY